MQNKFYLFYQEIKIFLYNKSTSDNSKKMNEDSMNNGIIPIDHISSEQHLHVDNQQNENSIQSDIKLKEIGSGIKLTNESPMTPTNLYDSFFYFSIIIQIFH